MAKARVRKQTFDCPDCGERLQLLSGTARDRQDPTMVAAAYACKECNIGFALIDGNIGYAPWDGQNKTW